MKEYSDACCRRFVSRLGASTGYLSAPLGQGLGRAVMATRNLELTLHNKCS